MSRQSAGLAADASRQHSVSPFDAIGGSVSGSIRDDHPVLTESHDRLMMPLTGSDDTRLPFLAAPLPEAAPSHWRTPPATLGGATMTRIFRVVLITIGLTLILAIPVAAQTTLAIEGHFREGFGRAASSDLCDLESPYCGDGTLRGLGRATTLSYDDGTYAITLASDPASTLVIQLTSISGGTPGGSADAPGQEHSYGHPESELRSWTVVSAASTGIFAGATGAGTQFVHVAGDVLILDLTGSVLVAE